MALRGLSKSVASLYSVGGTAGRSLASAGSESFVLPDLPYDYAALEPCLSAEIMDLHHKKHHQTYINNLNATLDKYHDAAAKGDVEQMIALEPALKFNGGGHINHTIFWTNLAAPGSAGTGEPTGDLKAAIESQFGNFEAFKKKFNASAASVQGSGWAWLGYNKEAARVEIATCANQDPLVTKGLVPLLGVDVWEHAYYLQYKNVRPDYLNAIWSVINFDNVSERLEAAKK